MSGMDFLQQLGRQTIINHPYLGAVVAGALTGAGFFLPGLWWWYGFGVVLLLLLLKRSQSRRAAFVIGGLAWTTSAAASLFWFWSVYPVEWLDVPGGVAQLLFIGGNWLTSALWIGLAGGVFGVMARLLTNGSFRWAGFLLPVVWVVCEVLGSFLFSVFTLGGESFVNTRFSYTYVGYLLAQHEWLIHLAAWGGVYTLSLVAITIPLALWWSLRTYVSARPLIALMVGVCISLGYGAMPQHFLPESHPSAIRVAVVETYDSGVMRASADSAGRHAVLQAAIERAVEAHPDYIILPEGAQYLQSFSNQAERQFVLNRTFTNQPIQLVDSGQVITDAGLVLRGYVYNHATKQTVVADKQYLVPQGEYIPALHATVASWFGYAAAVKTMQETIQYVPGPKRTQVGLPANAPGLMFCFESASPYGVRSLVAERPTEIPFIAHPISHAWFREPTQFWRQLDVMLRIQARWSNVPIVSAGNLAPSALYTPQGKVVRDNAWLDEASSFEWSVLVFDI